LNGEVQEEKKVPKSRKYDRNTKWVQLEKELQLTFATVGLIVSALDSYDGQIILLGSERMAGALTRACQRNPRLYKLIARTVQASYYADLAVAFGAVALPIAVHHGLLPDIGIDFGVSPDGLERSEDATGAEMEAGGPRFDFGSNGQWEDDTGPEPSSSA
jgi:hypothetical protein